MSRIYDALQKAEAERAQDADTSQSSTARTNNTGTRDNSSGNGTRFSSLSTSAALADFDPSRPTSLMSESTAGAASEAPALDLNRIITKPWSPVLSQLPALLERGAAIEQFRSLRARLFELRESRPLKTIMVTSGLPQEGKSFVATNLAFSLSRNKRGRILLIDGDMRRYTVHQLLGCDSEPGLADYLAGRAGALEIMQRNSHRSITLPEEAGQPAGAAGPTVINMPYLTFIAGGNGGDRAADLSNNYRFEELIRLVAPLFDWIIVDSSPVLPVADAVNLARGCDGVLLVARSGVTQFDDLQRTQAELKAFNVLGVVLNASDDAPAEGYYGYGYGHDGTR